MKGAGHIQVLKFRIRLFTRTQGSEQEIKASSARKESRARQMNKNPEIHKRKKDSQAHNPKQDFNPNVYYPERTSETKVTLTQAQRFFTVL